MSHQITVIITTFNREIELKKAIRSVLDQTYKADEILVVNNGEKKLDLSEIKDLNKFNFKIINCEKNLHAAGGRNIGANTATNYYLAFLDDDDYWEKNYLKKVSEVIDKAKPDLIVSTLYDMKTNNLYKRINDLNLTQIYLYNPGINGSNIVITKIALNQVGGFKNFLFPSEDKSLLIDLILNKKKIVITDSKVFCSLDTLDKTSRSLETLEKGTKNFIKYYNNKFSFSEKIMVNYKLSKIEIKNKKYTKIFKLFFLYFFYLFFKKN